MRGLPDIALIAYGKQRLVKFAPAKIFPTNRKKWLAKPHSTYMLSDKKSVAAS